MPMSQDLSPFVIAELEARESWKRRDYSAGYTQAGHAADLAIAAGDEHRWWKMVLLQAECLRDQGSFEECQQLAATLAAHPVSASAPDLGARAHILLAQSLQALGRLPEAVDSASAAAGLVAGDFENVYLHIQAQQALIAALAESGRLAAAWRECLDLKSLLTDVIDEDTAGKAYWVIGNVAFLTQRAAEGSKYHDLAAEQALPLPGRGPLGPLQPRLGGNAPARPAQRRRHAPLHRTRGTGHRGSGRQRARHAGDGAGPRPTGTTSPGDMDSAINILAPLRSKFPVLATQTAAEASFVLGKAMMAQGNDAESLQILEEAATLFDTAAATERSATVRDYLVSVKRQQRFLQGG